MVIGDAFREETLRQASLDLADDDLAERLGKTIANTVSRSVPYLAAPAFAAAMLEHQVLRTIAVGRHVLLIADVRVADQAGLDWSPRRDYRLAPGDRLIVLATRKGLEPFLSVR